uniref:Uncharacterized protein n=1 Tax=Cacopsylla melanoneura TaxID=428564 RepID=A0A8D9A9P0_9HEMI
MVMETHSMVPVAPWPTLSFLCMVEMLILTMLRNGRSTLTKVQICSKWRLMSLVIPWDCLTQMSGQLSWHPSTEDTNHPSRWIRMILKQFRHCMVQPTTIMVTEAIPTMMPIPRAVEVARNRPPRHLPPMMMMLNSVRTPRWTLCSIRQRESLMLLKVFITGS